MMKHFKRYLSMICVLAMLVTGMPIGALAEGDENFSAEAASESSGSDSHAESSGGGESGSHSESSDSGDSGSHVEASGSVESESHYESVNSHEAELSAEVADVTQVAEPVHNPEYVIEPVVKDLPAVVTPSAGEEEIASDNLPQIVITSPVAVGELAGTEASENVVIESAVNDLPTVVTPSAGEEGIASDSLPQIIITSPVTVGELAETEASQEEGERTVEDDAVDLLPSDESGAIAGDVDTGETDEAEASSADTTDTPAEQTVDRETDIAAETPPSVEGDKAPETEEIGAEAQNDEIPADSLETGEVPDEIPVKGQEDVTTEGETALSLAVNPMAASVAAMLTEGLQAAAPASSSTGNTAKDMAASVEFEDPLNPSDNPVPIATLNDLIREKLASQKTLSGTVTVALGRNTTYTGDLSLKRMDWGTVAEDFKLELKSETAGEDNLSGDGSTVLNGNVAIEGLNVLMAGVKMALNKVITVMAGAGEIGGGNSTATLEYYGTQADDIVTVDVGNGGIANITTGAGDDRVGVTTGGSAGATVVDTGEGDDTVYGFIYGGKKSVIQTGAGDDELQLYTYQDQPEGSADAVVVASTGEGSDEVQVALSGSGVVQVGTGGGDDAITVYGRYGSGDFSLNTGDGSDRVKVSKNYELADQVRIAPNVVGYDEMSVKTTQDGIATAPTSVMNIAMAGSGNRADIDLSIGDTFAKVVLSGANSPRVHLTGALDGGNAAPISGDARALTLHTENGNALRVESATDMALTDAMANKPVQYIDLQSGKDSFDITNTSLSARPFTDYVVRGKDISIPDIAMFKNANLLLSNLVLDSDQLKMNGIYVTNITANGMNVLVKGKDITFEGVVSADNVMAYATDRTAPSISDVIDDFSLSEEYLEEIGEMLSNIINVDHSATVTVSSGAKITAARDVDLNARVEETGGMLSLLPDSLNILNVKVGKAAVNIDGEVVATKGDVYAEATSRTIAGYQVDIEETDAVKAATGYSVPRLQDKPLPLAVNVLVEKAEARVGAKGSVTAGGDIHMEASSETRALAHAASWRVIPLAIGVNVIDAQVNSIVEGTLTAGGSVSVEATGIQKSTVISDRSTSQSFNSGAYLGLNVVVQDVVARIRSEAEKGAARVTAGGNVDVDSKAISDARTTISAGISYNTPVTQSTRLKNSGFNFVSALLQAAGEWLPEDGDQRDRTPAINVAKNKLKTADYNVTIQNADDDELRGTARTEIVDDGNGGIEVNVYVDPAEKYNVQKVIYRWLVPGQSTYSVAEAPRFGDYNDVFHFTMPKGVKDVTAVVYYSDKNPGDPKNEVETGKIDNNTLFRDKDFNSILKDATDGATDYTFEDPEDGEATALLSLNVEAGADGKPGHGALLTGRCDSEGNSILSVVPGKAVELVPNPQTGYRLSPVKTLGAAANDTEGALLVRYYVTGDAQVRVSTVKADADGRYLFTVPDNVNAGHVIEVTAAYTAGQAPASTAAKASPFQAAGAIGLGVNVNHGQAVIGENSVVTAAGTVSLNSKEQTRMITTADGTEVADAAARQAMASFEKRTERPKQKTYTEYTVGGAQYGLRLSGNAGGTVSLYDDDSYQNGYDYTFLVKAETGYQVQSATVGYYRNGEYHTAEITDMEETGGGWLYKLHIKELGGWDDIDEVDDVLHLAPIEYGSAIDIGFTFSSADKGVIQNGQGTDQWLVRNPVNIRTNVLSLSTAADPTNVGFTRMGTVAFVKYEKELDGAAGNYYYFKVDPDINNGYTIKSTNPDVTHPERSNAAVLYVSYIDGAGVTRRAPLMRDTSDQYGIWYFNANTVSAPAGAVLTVNATFTEDLHKVVTKVEGDTPGGSVTVDRQNIKLHDTITIQTMAQPGYVVDKVVVNRGKEVPVDATGKATYTLDNIPLEGADIPVVVTFKPKTILVEDQADASGAGKLVFSENKVAEGQALSVSLPEADIRAGYRLEGVRIWINRGSDMTGSYQTLSNGQIILPESDGDFDKYIITYDASDRVLKQFEITGHTASQTVDGKTIKGSLQSQNRRVDQGETVIVNAIVDQGCRVKAGTAKAIIKTGGASHEVAMTQISATQWSFKMPVMTDEQAKNATVSLECAFEPGSANSTGDTFALGAAIGIQVVHADNTAAIRGAEVTGSDLTLKARSSETKTLTAKAGYSQGTIGIGGAVGVQVTGSNTTAEIDEKSTVNITKNSGNLILNARSGHTFGLTADAANPTPAGKIGVGAGIAVSVNGADTYAGIAGGAKINVNSERLGDVQLQALQTILDSVSSTAGSKGGIAATPVASVDVFGGSATADLGAVNSEQLKSGSAIVKASNDARHTVVATATAGGALVAMGGAFGIAVIGDTASAQLGQRLDASGPVRVNSIAKTSLYDIVTAGVAGAGKGSAATSGASGSADRQANKLMGGAGKLAATGSAGSASVNPASGRQKAQSTEGAIGGAAAMAVGVLGGKSYAQVGDGVDITTPGLVSVVSRNRTQATLKANASAAKTKYGVGVGVAIDVVNIDNVATLGDGEIKAGTLEVMAVMTPNMGSAVSGEQMTHVPATDDAFIQYIEQAIREFIASGEHETAAGEAISNFSADVIATFAAYFADALLEQTGLKTILGNGGLESKLDRLESITGTMWEHLKALPEAIVAPVLRFKDDIVTMTDMTTEDWDNAMENVANDLKLWLPAEIAQVAKQTVSTMLYSIVGGALDVTGQCLHDKKLPDKQTVTDSLTATLKGVVNNSVTRLVEDTVEEMMTLIAAQIPILSRDRLEDLLSVLPDTPSSALESYLRLEEQIETDGALNTVKTTAKDVARGYVNELATDFMKTFDNNIFNVEKMVSGLLNGNPLVMIKNSLERALKEASNVAISVAIDDLVGALDVSLAPEGMTDKHSINTTAISGAGASDVGVAGALALTVLNTDTRAEIRGGDDDITVTGKVTVQAVETRRHNNIATAAADADGNPDTNDRAGSAESADVGGGSAAGDTVTNFADHISVVTSAGGEVVFDDANKSFTILPDKGYMLSSSERKVTYEWIDDAGKTHTGTLKVNDDNTVDYTACLQGKLNDTFVTVTVNFEAKTKEIPQPVAKLNGKEQDVPYLLSLRNNSRETTFTEFGYLEACEGDELLITVRNLEDHRLRQLVYEESDGSTVEIVNIKRSNPDETTYSMIAPEGQVYQIRAEYDDYSGTYQQNAVDDKGLTVGVGASVGMVIGNSNVRATVGERDVTSGDFALTSTGDHQEKINASAGTDPLTSGGATGTKSMDYSVDAALALNVMDNDIRTLLDEDARITTEKAGNAENPIASGDVTITSTEKAGSWIQANGFSTGSTTAAGAAVALNLGFSDIANDALGRVRAEGNVTAAANSHSEDRTTAMATTVGADIQRMLDKFAYGVEMTEKGVQTLVDGSWVDKLDQAATEKLKKQNSQNATSKKVNQRLKDTAKTTDDGATADYAPTSNNALKAHDVKTANNTAGTDAIKTANDETKSATGKELGMESGTGKPTKFQVAAAVGLTVATHRIVNHVGSDLEADGSIAATANNTANFNTMGSGAAMSLAERANSIAAGVAVTVAQNQAKVIIDEDVEAEGDVTLAASLTQNMDGVYKGKLAAQALSGALSGERSDASVAGAIAMVLSRAETSASIAGGAARETRSIKGRQVSLTAYDKSKLALRAGGVSISQGSTVGTGLAAAITVSENQVTAEMGNNTHVEAKGLNVTAKKAAVTFDDYDCALSAKNLITDSSKLSPDQRKNAETGIIDVHRSPTDDSYTVDINVRSTDIVKMFDALNFLSSTNYYAEAMAGSIMGPGAHSSLSLGGSASVASFNNKIRAILGDNFYAKLIMDDDITAEGALTGAMNLEAQDETNARLLAGAISAAASKASVGLGFALVNDHDTSEAIIGKNTQIFTDGDVTAVSGQKGDIEVYNAAASGSYGSGGNSTAEGGSMNIVNTSHAARTTVGASTDLKSGGSLNIKADTDVDLMAFAASAALSTGKVAAGGTAQVIVNQAESLVNLNENHRLKALHDVAIAANMKEQLISGIASASAAVGSGAVGAGGNVGVLVSLSKANVTGKGGAGTVDKNGIVTPHGIESTAGNVFIDADSETVLVNAALSAVGSTQVSVGAGFNVNVFGRTAAIDMQGAEQVDRYRISALGDIMTRADGRDITVTVDTVFSGSTGNVALAGTFVTDVARSTIKNNLSKIVTVEAGNNAAFDAYHNNVEVMVAGALGASLGTVGLAGAFATMVEENTVETNLGQAVVSAGAQAMPAIIRDDLTIAGIHVGAESVQTHVTVGVGAAASNTAAVSGTVVSVVNRNTVKAVAESAKLAISDILYAPSAGHVRIHALNDTVQGIGAGGANGSGTAAVGLSVVTQVSGNNVDALAGNIVSRGDTSITARNDETDVMVAASVGGSGTAAVELGTAVQVLMSRVHALQKGIATIGGNYTLTADQDATIVNTAVTIAGSGTAAVTPVAAVIYTKGETMAALKQGATLNMKTEGKRAAITAHSDRDVVETIVGAAGSGVAGVSGALGLNIGRETVSALAEEGSTQNLNNSYIDVDAGGDYLFVGSTVAVGISGTAGVAVNADITVLRDSVTAAIDGKVNMGRDVSVRADSKRDLISAVANVSGSGVAGVGISILGLFAGRKLSKDAADMLTYGNASDKDNTGKKTVKTVTVTAKNDDGTDRVDEKGNPIMETVEVTEASIKTFDVEQFLKTAAAQGADTTEISDLGDMLASDDFSFAEQQVGQKGQDFDAASGIFSEDFNKSDFADADDDKAQRGENTTFTDTKDISDAKNVAAYSYTDDPTDALIARIGSTAEIEADNASVSADQNTLADLYGGTASGAGVAGVGISAALALMRSNVEAASTGRVNLKDGKLSVNAVSRANEFDPEDILANDALSDEEKEAAIKEEQARTEALSTTLGSQINPANRSLRVVSLSGAFGVITGVAVAPAVLVTDNVTKSLVSGTATGIRAMDVNAKANYVNAIASSVTVGGGLVGVGVSAGMAISMGEISAIVDGNAKISQSTGGAAGDYNITTDTGYSTVATSAMVSGGLVGVNAGLTLAINRMKQHTLIDNGASIMKTGAGGLTISAKHQNNGNAWLASAPVGGVAVGAAAAAVDIAPTILTGIGRTASQNGKTGNVSLSAIKTDIAIKNDVSAVAKPGIVRATVGAVGVAGNILLSFNDTKADAQAVTGQIAAKSIDIDSSLSATGESLLTEEQAAGVSVGLSTAYVDLHGVNNATMDIQKGEFTGDVRVTTGRDGESSKALAETIVAHAGLVDVSLNTAVARNRMENNARLNVSDSLKLTNGALTVKGNNAAGAKSDLIGVSATAGGSITGSASAAVMEAKQTQTVTIRGLEIAGGRIDFGSNLKADTDAHASIGSGTIMAANANTAVAYGRAKSIVDVKLQKGANADAQLKLASLDINNVGGDAVKSKIENESLDVISANAAVGVAYSQDTYSTKLNLDGAEVNADGATLQTAMDNTTDADVTPSAGGVDASLLTLNVNIAVAKSTAGASTDLTGTGALNAKTLNVKTNGGATSKAIVNTPSFSIAEVTVNPNMAYARDKTSYLANVTGSLWLDVTDNMAIDAEKKYTDATSAQVGGNGWWTADTRTNKVSLSLINAKVNVVKAINDATIRAQVEGVTITGGGNLNINATGSARAKGDTVTENAVNAIGVGVNNVTTDAAATIEALLRRSDMTVGDLNVTANYDLNSDATVAASPFEGKMFSYDDNRADARTSATVTALIDQTSKSEPWNVNIIGARNISVGTKAIPGYGIFANAKVHTPAFAVGLMNIKNFKTMANVDAELLTGIRNNTGTIAANGALTVSGKSGQSRASASVASPYNDFTARGVEAVAVDLSTAEANNALKSVVEVGSETTGRITANNSVTIQNSADDLKAYAEALTNSKLSLFDFGKLYAEGRVSDQLTTNITGGLIQSGGDMTIQTAATSNAEGKGSTPGGTAGVIEGSQSDVKAKIDAQTLKTNIQSGATLMAEQGALTIASRSAGKARAAMKNDLSINGIGVDEASIPTTSKFVTNLSVGDAAAISAKRISMTTMESAEGNSEIDDSAVSLGLNVSKTIGENTHTAESTTSIGKNVKLTAAEGIDITKDSDATLKASTSYVMDFALGLDVNTVRANNTVNRRSTLSIGEGTQIMAADGDINLAARTGVNDNLSAYSNANGEALVVNVQDTKTTTDLTNAAKVTVARSVRVEAGGGLNINADTSAGVINDQSRSQTGTGMAVVAHSTSDVNFNNSAIVDIGGSSGSEVQLTGSAIDIAATGLNTRATIWADAISANGFGGSTANTNANLNLTRQVNLHDARLTAESVALRTEDQAKGTDGKDNSLTLQAHSYKKGIDWTEHHETNTNKTVNYLTTTDGTTDAGKKVSPRNVIFTANALNLTENSEAGWKVPVTRRHSDDDSGYKKDAKYDWDGDGGNVGLAHRNDFLSAATTAYVSDNQAPVLRGAAAPTLRAAIPSEGLSALAVTQMLYDISQGMESVNPLGKIYMDSHPEQVINTHPGDIFVLDVEAAAGRDIALTADDLSRYLLWTNELTGSNMYLLPNATRFSMVDGRVQDVQRVILVNIDGERRLVDLAIRIRPGDADGYSLALARRSRLDYSTGHLTIPDAVNFWLYMDELSGAWMKRQFGTGTFRLAHVELTDWDGAAMPKFETIETGFTFARGADGTDWYYVGAIPTQAKGDIYLMAVDTTTDEVRFYRAADPTGDMVEQDVFLCRDADADGRSEIAWNAILTDRAGEASTLEVVTDLMNGESRKTPASLELGLRALTLRGHETNCYSVRRVIFAHADIVQGNIRFLDGAYAARCTDDAYESDYVRIDGVNSADTRVTIKAGEPLWPEWVTDSQAHDIAQRLYYRVGGSWRQN